MTDTGSIGHVDRLFGAALKLYGGVVEDAVTLRVFAGPRQHQVDAGEVTVYMNGVRMGTLGATPAGAGELVLKWIGEDGEGEGSATVVLSGGTATEPFGSITLRRPGEPEQLVLASFDDQGPLVGVAQGLLYSILRPGGIETTGEKNFVAAHPRDPRLSLYYCSMEGPEAGVYLRGQARLAAGKATVELEDHFAMVASPEGLTVQLTPRSAESRGVCAKTVSCERLVIEELCGGQGSYAVDWVLHGVRKGFEDFQVIRPRKHP